MPHYPALLKNRFTVTALVMLAGCAIAAAFTWWPRAGEARATLPSAAAAVPAPQAPTVLAGLSRNFADAAMSGRPIEIGVFGDSFGDGIWFALNQQLGHEPAFRLHQLSQRSTGFAGWTDMAGDFREKLDLQPLDVAVISFGANDTHGLTFDGRHHDFMSAEWRRVVGARIDAAVNLLRERGVQVYWIGLPRMRRPAFEAKARALNNFYAERMRALNVPFIDTVAATSDTQGRYVERLVNPRTGQPMLARAGDGIHMTMQGYTVLTAGLARHLRVRVAAARAEAARINARQADAAARAQATAG